jgi:threonine synthase
VGTFFSHLECSVPCGGGPFDPRQRHQLCACGAPLFARYDLTSAKRWSPSTLAAREATLWRYREILPLLESDSGLDQPVSLGEGWTPLLRARALGRAVGIERAYVKDDSRNPAASVKARGIATAATRALHLGARVLTIAATGSGGPALAAYAARAGLDARVFMPKDARRTYVKESEFAGAAVTLTSGSLREAAAHAADRAESAGWYDMTAFREPYRVEGEKTLGYEIAEQLGWQLPDWIACPLGEGTTVVALWKAFAEMAALGWIDPVHRPHLLCIQAAGCAPLVRAFGSGAERALPWDAPQTVADDVRVPETIGDVLALRAIRESSGVAMAVGDAEMLAVLKECAQAEGLSLSPETGGVVHALRVLASEGRIKSRDTVVVLNTGTALRYLD